MSEAANHFDAVLDSGRNVYSFTSYSLEGVVLKRKNDHIALKYTHFYQ